MNFGYFMTDLKQWATPEKVGEWPYIFLNDRQEKILKSQGSLYLEFIPKDGLFHKMLLLLLVGFFNWLM